ncbi:MAG: hypothetical protein ACNI3C_06400 [Candidatus Marinarcus sp.]|uniref:hypothetical protein n=1 Tax=Candidatus Marinarcus sp. TaxID=3100987 RepID=UPI003B00A611
MSVKRDKKKKAEKKIQNNLKNNQTKELTQIEIQNGLKKLFDPLKLIAPKTINHDIKTFCKTISDFDPFFIHIEPEPWCRQSCCDLNIQEYIKLNGGQIVCGYKIWYNKPSYMEAERHAVWFSDGIYKDISFNADGEEDILFVPDVIEKQNTLEENKSRIRWGKDSKTKQLIKAQNNFEKIMPMQQMSNEESWNTMLTYEQWQNGQRMSNIQISNS